MSNQRSTMNASHNNEFNQIQEEVKGISSEVDQIIRELRALRKQSSDKLQRRMLKDASSFLGMSRQIMRRGSLDETAETAT